MHKGTYASRLLDAQRALLGLVETAVLSGAIDPAYLDGVVSAQAEKKPDIRSLYELEALAPAVGALIAAVSAAEDAKLKLIAAAEAAAPGPTLAEIADLPGLSKTSRNTIQQYAEALAAEAEAAEADEAADGAAG